MKVRTKEKLDAWLEELDSLESFTDGTGLTVDEIAAQLEWSPNRVRRMLTRLAAGNRLRVERRRSMRIDGVKSLTPVYSLVKAKRK